MSTMAKPGESYADLLARIRTDDQEESDGQHIHLYLHGVGSNADLAPSTQTNPPVSTSTGEFFLPATRNTIDAEEKQVGTLQPAPSGYHYEIRDLAIFLVPDNGNEEDVAFANQNNDSIHRLHASADSALKAMNDRNRVFYKRDKNQPTRDDVKFNRKNYWRAK